MKIGIFGAGAIGGYLAAQLALDGHEVSCIARGAHLEAMRKHGLRLRIDGAAEVGPHKTSMLQDLERGRPMEIDALVTAVQEMARLVGVETPYIDSVLGLIQQRGRVLGLYQPSMDPTESMGEEGRELVD